REIAVALAYSPEVRTTRLDYVASKLKFEFVMAGDLDEVEQSFTKGREDKEISERDIGRWLPGTDRNHGTLQVSRWRFKEPPRRGKRLFVVVTRQDNMWSPTHVKETAEPYALAVVMSDCEQENARLYAELQAKLQARAQARARARARARVRG
ncbi:MAG: peptidase S8, partial [Salinisphaera sp.]|nr:peptidase S8 [Salinisphaera sp.]